MPFNRMHEDWEDENGRREDEARQEREDEQEQQEYRDERDCNICDIYDDTIDYIKDKFKD